MSELDLARQYATEAMAVTRRRAASADPEALRDLSVSLVRLGDVVRDLGDPATAAAHYQHALHIRRRLADELDTPQALRDLSDSLGRLGDVTRDLGDPVAARGHHQQAL